MAIPAFIGGTSRRGSVRTRTARTILCGRAGLMTHAAPAATRPRASRIGPPSVHQRQRGARLRRHHRRVERLPLDHEGLLRTRAAQPGPHTLLGTSTNTAPLQSTPVLQPRIGVPASHATGSRPRASAVQESRDRLHPPRPCQARGSGVHRTLSKHQHAAVLTPQNRMTNNTDHRDQPGLRVNHVMYVTLVNVRVPTVSKERKSVHTNFDPSIPHVSCARCLSDRCWSHRACC